MDLISSPDDIVIAKKAHAEAMEQVQSDKYLPWPEKWRPKTIGQCILPKEIKDTITFAMECGMFNHMIFHSGKPGTGKTTVARAIPEELGCDYLFLPIARRSREILDQIQEYACQKSPDGKPRFVILDEADRPSGDREGFYTALQPLIEGTSRTLRFILTCNNLHRLPEPIRSRCAPISFAHSGDDETMKWELWNRIKEIATKETEAVGGTWDQNTLGMIAKFYYPDMRAIIGSMMMTFIRNRGSIIGEPIKWSGDYAKIIWDIIQEGDDVKLRKWVTANIVDYDSLYVPLGLYFIERMEKPMRLKFAIMLAEYQFRSGMPAVDPEINLSGMLASTMLLLGK